MRVAVDAAKGVQANVAGCNTILIVGGSDKMQTMWVRDALRQGNS
jgi:hypothetical protein